MLRIPTPSPTPLTELDCSPLFLFFSVSIRLLGLPGQMSFPGLQFPNYLQERLLKYVCKMYVVWSPCTMLPGNQGSSKTNVLNSLYECFVHLMTLTEMLFFPENTVVFCRTFKSWLLLLPHTSTQKYGCIFLLLRPTLRSESIYQCNFFALLMGYNSPNIKYLIAFFVVKTCGSVHNHTYSDRVVYYKSKHLLYGFKISFPYFDIIAIFFRKFSMHRLTPNLPFSYAKKIFINADILIIDNILVNYTLK